MAKHSFAYPPNPSHGSVAERSQEVQVGDWSVQNCGLMLHTSMLGAFIREPKCGASLPFALLAFSKHSFLQVVSSSRKSLGRRQYFFNLIMFINKNVHKSPPPCVSINQTAKCSLSCDFHPLLFSSLYSPHKGLLAFFQLRVKQQVAAFDFLLCSVSMCLCLCLHMPACTSFEKA